MQTEAGLPISEGADVVAALRLKRQELLEEVAKMQARTVQKPANQRLVTYDKYRISPNRATTLLGCQNENYPAVAKSDA